jgi:hemolysin III
VTDDGRVAAERPRFRGLVHLAAFTISLPLGVALFLAAPTSLARAGAVAFAVSVAAMFGVGSLFHRVHWEPVAKSRMAVLDHSTIYSLIAGTYTPFALLVLRPGWRAPVLAAVWVAAAIGTAAKLRWRAAPTWVAAATCVAIGWSGVVVLPQIVDRIGLGGTSLMVAGGAAYTTGAIVYVRRRPDPFPRTFGYHEVFHALVVVAVLCQYAAISFFVVAPA